MFKFFTDAVETAVQVTGVGQVAESIGIKVEANIYENGVQATVSGPLADVAETVVNAPAAIGDAICDGAKVVTDAVETVVQETGIGHAAECIGIKVEENIHENGFQGTVSGPLAVVATAGMADKVQANMKLKSSGGDFGGVGDAVVKDGELVLGSANVSADSRGAGAQASAGVSVDSGFKPIREMRDVGNIGREIIDKLEASNKGAVVSSILEHLNCDVGALVSSLLNTILDSMVGAPVDIILDALHELAQVYVSLGFGVTVGGGAKLLAGQETEVQIADKKQVFHMYEFGGKLAVGGLSGGFGVTKEGNTFDNMEKGVMFVVNGSVNSVNVSCSMIVTTNIGSQDIIEFIKNAVSC
uniref:Uncharacterized protein n=1 Tax=Heterosigma akashiwo TaxID=2829 RepID=A0A6T5NQI2_HETAK|mmetsp:Transcript_19011/g.26117  ORF Transcript_19011/g.26117 Transcript_19011/m.26117 type:complete len:357 (-) Transcript_19011:367-1437(-)